MTTLFDRLYAELHVPVLSRIRHLVGDPEAAEDLSQEVWAKMAARLDEYAARPDFNGPALIYTAANNRALDHLRRGQSVQAGGRVRFAPLVLASGGVNPEAEAAAVERLSPEALVGASMAARERACFLVLLMEALRPGDRRLLWLVEYAELSYADVARQRKLTTGGLKAAVFRARERREALAVALLEGLRAGRDPVARFGRYLDRSSGTDGCWRWLGAHNSKGYPAFRYAPKKFGAAGVSARRLGVLLARGPQPPWVRVATSCGTKACVNPAHGVVVRNAGRHYGADGRVLLGGAHVPLSDAERGVLPDAGDLRRRREALAYSTLEVETATGITKHTLVHVEAGRSFHPTYRLRVDAFLAREEAAVAAGAGAPVADAAECRRRREALGLTQKGLARAAGLSSTAVWHLEGGAHACFPRVRRTVGRALTALERDRAQGVSA